MIRTSAELIKNDKFKGKVLLDSMVEFNRIDTVDQFCDTLKGHLEEIIEHFRRTCHEAIEDQES